MNRNKLKETNMKKTVKLPAKKTPAKKAVTKGAYATKVCCTPNTRSAFNHMKPEKLSKKELHELDTQLQESARQELARHYLKLARFKDGERIFKPVGKSRNQNSALDLLGAAFDLSDSELNSLTASL